MTTADESPPVLEDADAVEFALARLTMGEDGVECTSTSVSLRNPSAAQVATFPGLNGTGVT